MTVKKDHSSGKLYTVVGASGGAGQAVAAALQARGHRVRSVARIAGVPLD